MIELDDTINVGIQAFRVPDRHHPRTAVVLGVPRGGTSMVAGALYHLGILMGDKLSQGTFEDRPLSMAIEDGNVDLARNIIDDRNHRAPIWGWKRPSAFKHLDFISREFRNPYYLMVFRDVFAIATRRNMTIGKDIHATMKSTIEAQRTLVNFATATDQPLLGLSYEKAVQRPRVTVEAIAEFLGVATTEAAISFVRADPDEYLQRNRPGAATT